jgi:hypothetical protein
MGKKRGNDKFAVFQITRSGNVDVLKDLVHIIVTDFISFP